MPWSPWHVWQEATYPHPWLLGTEFDKVTNISIGRSSAAEVGGSSSMLHESNLLEFIFQGNLHSNKRVAGQFIAIGKEEGGKDAQAQPVV